MKEKEESRMTGFLGRRSDIDNNRKEYMNGELAWESKYMLLRQE